MNKFWICYVRGTNGGSHLKHYFKDSAQREAERLARLPNVMGEQVYLFECIGVCRVEPNPVKWRIPIE